MKTSGIVTFARWSKPLPGRTTSLRNHAEMPAFAPAAPSAGLARSRNAWSRARRGASATRPRVPATPPTTAAVSWTSFSRDWPSSSPGAGKSDRRSRRKMPATIVARPATPISAGPKPARGPSLRSSADANATVQPPSATNPAVITWGSFASFAARPLMCSCLTWYSSWRRWASNHAPVNAAGPSTPHSAPKRPVRGMPCILEASRCAGRTVWTRQCW